MCLLWFLWLGKVCQLAAWFLESALDLILPLSPLGDLEEYFAYHSYACVFSDKDGGEGGREGEGEGERDREREREREGGGGGGRGVYNVGDILFQLGQPIVTRYPFLALPLHLLELLN